MAQIDKPNLFFNTVLYTGNASTRSITGVGFQPDMVWTKSRGNSNNHNIYDVVRGATKRVYPNSTSQEATTSNTLTSFDSDGFSLGDQDNVNANGITMASWSWKAGGSGSANNVGSINSTVSVNTTSGCSIVAYTGNASNATVGHGLGSAPKMILIKGRNQTEDWTVWHDGFGDNDKYGVLNGTVPYYTASTVWNSTAPTSTVFHLGTASRPNTNFGTYIAFCFSEKKGFSKFGRYLGNGNNAGQFVYTGFKPAWLMRKCTVNSTAETWLINDNKRPGYNQNQLALFPSNSNAEDTATHNAVDFCANGFKVRTNDGRTGGNGNTYIYAAFAENPIVGSNNIPATAG
ncbi:hypothetical protein HTVC103P_gp62 [Pelagibacter phage HTVC103P]|nr:hypothetical protein HTVC103P_gp62 [Pelagibacter phage HTVC103P]